MSRTVLLLLFGVVAFVIAVVLRSEQPNDDVVVSSKKNDYYHRYLKVLLDPKTIREKQRTTTFLEQSKLAEAMSTFEPLIDNSIKDPWKRKLFERLDRIRILSCGSLCNINDYATFGNFAVETEESTFGVRLEIPGISCNIIMRDEDIDVSDSTLPFPVPTELDKYYTMGGMISEEQYEPLYKKLNDIHSGGNQLSSNNWTVEMVNEYIENCKDPEKHVYDGYGGDTRRLLDWTRDHVPMKGKRVLVVGSERPWVEAICLYLGAAHVMTLEYGRINSLHPQISTATPDQFRKLYSSGQLEPFDVVVSYSSVEHAGLGRYGDALNPWGDLLAIARVRCVTKEGGYMVLALPTDKYLEDSVQFNSHRVYGRIRYPLLTANWVQVDAKDHPPHLIHDIEQPPFVFRKITAL